MTSTRRRKFAGAGALGLTIAGFGAGLAGNAAAADAPTGPTTTTDNGTGPPPDLIGYQTDPTGNATFLGTFRPVGYNDNVVCIDAGATRPSEKTPATVVNDQPEIAYLLSKYSQTKDNLTAAALTYIVKQAMDSDQAKVEAAYNNLTVAGADKAAFDQKVASMKADAAANVGPYTSKLSFTPADSAKAGDTVQLQGVGVSGKSGNLAGFTTTVTLSGPATFSDGSTTKTVTSTAQAQSLDVKITGAGSVKASETTTMPNSTLYLHPAQATGYQRMVEQVNNGTEPVTANASLTTAGDTTNTPGTVNITTKAQGGTATKGAQIYDQITGTGPANQTLTGTDVLYRVPAGTPITSANAEKVTSFNWSATTDASGNLSTTTDKYTVPENGYDYYFQEANAAGSGKDASGNTVTWPASTGKLGDTAESVLGSTPSTSTVSVTTAVQGANSGKGSQISDNIMGTAPAGATVTGTDDLYRVKAGTTPTEANATKVTSFPWSAKAGADGKFSTTTAKYTIPDDGYDYFYVENHAAGSTTDSSGKTITWPAGSGKFGDTTETSLYKKPSTPSTPSTPSKPVTPVSPSTPSVSTPVVGPKVQTDMGGHAASHDSIALDAMAVAGVASLAGAGFVARRRSN